MNKPLMSFAAIFCALQLCAAPQYNFGANVLQDGYTVKAYNDRDGSVNSDIGGGWYMDVLQDSRLAFKIDNANHTSRYRSVGYFTFSGQEILGTYELTFGADGIAETLKLAAGEKIGFWITGASGETHYSTVFAEGAWTDVLTGRGSADSDSGKFDFSVDGKKAVGVLIGTSAANTPVGQPLPGLLASLAIGGGTLAAAALRRRNKGKRA